MRKKLFTLTASLWLSACAGDDPRYRNTEMLEKPPLLAIHKTPEELAPVQDDSVIPKKKHKRGLADEVSLTPVHPPVINIKLPLAEAWDTLDLALKQSEITITDQERDKGQMFVSYRPRTLFGAVSSLTGGKDSKQVIYVLTLAQHGAESQVSAKLASPAEQSSSLEADRIDTEAEDDAEDLLNKLFLTLRDDLLF